MTFQKGNKIGNRFQKGHTTNIGRKHSNETKLKQSLCKIGNKYPLGCKRSPESNMKNRLAHLGVKNHKWLGDDISNVSLHGWIRRHLQIPELCQICNKNPPKDLANISPTYNPDTYNRDFKNWQYLCRSCHTKLDGRVGNLNNYCKCMKGRTDFKWNFCPHCGEPRITPPEEE